MTIKTLGRGGKRAGAGRKKGVANKATNKRRDAARRALDSGVTPLDFMLSVLRDPKAEKGRRDDMAKAAAPYVHPKLSAIEHKGEGGGPIDMHWTVELVRPK